MRKVLKPRKSPQPEMVHRLATWIEERYNIFIRKSRGDQTPWTKDKILASYRFCNVHREDDRVTKWVAENWRAVGHRDFWLASVVARLVNEPETLAELPLPWSPRFTPAVFCDVLESRAARKLRVFNPAYIVSTNGAVMPKPFYLAEFVIRPLWDNREAYRPTKDHSLASYHALLRAQHGLGSFMAAQVVADVKYTAPLYGNAPDWWTWAASGPGSRRGLNRVCGEDRNAPWKEEVWLALMAQLHPLVTERLKERSLAIPHIHMQDLQNCLCEFDKYERARLLQGRPKQKYSPETRRIDK